MSVNNKSNVIVLLSAAKAFEESTCNSKESAKGPNGTAYGLFQLHLNNEYKNGPCKAGDSRNPESSITCALSMLNQQMATGNMFRQKDNYWDVLRPKRYISKTMSYIDNPSYIKIRNAIARFPPCKDKSKFMEGRLFQDTNIELYNTFSNSFIDYSNWKFVEKTMLVQDIKK
ncbi:MAG: hypothetical protein ACK41T_00410 [Pseudobdellovibrio sp.]